MSTPNSSLTLYAGVPLDNTYEHTYANTSNFSSTSSATPAQPLYYIRPDKNMVRISHSGMKVNGFNLYNCNYLTFKNSSFENKTFYCFVTDVRYINDDTAEIDFEIDVMMTWVATGNITFEQCFVEREHTDTDEIGEHILEEPVDVGNYLYKDGIATTMQMHICAGVTATFDASADPPQPDDPLDTGKWKAGAVDTYMEGDFYVCDGVARYLFDQNGAQIQSGGLHNFGSLSALLASLKNDSNNGQLNFLKFIYYYPSIDAISANPVRAKSQGIGDNLNYIPKNNKLWTYPYYCANVNNFEGSMVDIPFEYSTNNYITFQLKTSTPDASASIEPINMKTNGKGYMLVKTKFPVMSASSNEYSSYQARLKSQMTTDLISNVAVPAATGALMGSSAAGVGGVVGAAIGGGIGLINYITKAVGGGEQAKLDVISVGNNAGFITAKNGTYEFGIFIKTIRTDYAKAIDAFFTKFGYKVNELKVPSKYCSRLGYKYVKTIGCAIRGSAPASAVSKISEIMDNGITFWNKPNIGEY